GIPRSQKFVPGEPSLGYHTLGGHHRQVAWLSFATSFRVNQRLYFGTGLSITTTAFELSYLRDTALDAGAGGIASDCGGAPCGIENPQAAERYDLSVGSPGVLGTQNLAIVAGAIYQVAQGWWVGVSYHSPPGLQAPLTLTGTARVTPAPRDAASRPDPYDAQAEVIYTPAQSVSVGVRGPLMPGLEVVAGARWQGLSRQHQLDIRVFGRAVPPGTPEWQPRYLGLRDAIALEAGVEAAPSRRLRLATRLGFESG